MKKVIIFLFVVLNWQCSSSLKEVKHQPIYIYDIDGLFSIYQNRNDSMDYLFFQTRKTILSYYDTIKIGENYKIYDLIHYIKYNEYSDTSFSKNSSYLDSISYFDSDWMNMEENLDSLWNPIKCWKCSGIYDTTRIYLILPIENSDSLQFLQVHRWFHQTQ